MAKKIGNKKIEEHKKAVFALVYAQLSESSSSELKDHGGWMVSFASRDLLYLMRNPGNSHCLPERQPSSRHGAGPVLMGNNENVST